MIDRFRTLKSKQDSHTKKEGNLEHYCAFFLPIHRASRSIYLCHHKKANDWIPPGGHVDPGETPKDAAIREMHEELHSEITANMLTPYSLSIKPINRPEVGCVTHFDVWYLVEMPARSEFVFDHGEYFAAGWFPLEEAVSKIAFNPDFAQIVSRVF